MTQSENSNSPQKPWAQRIEETVQELEEYFKECGLTKLEREESDGDQLTVTFPRNQESEAKPQDE